MTQVARGLPGHASVSGAIHRPAAPPCGAGGGERRDLSPHVAGPEVAWGASDFEDWPQARHEAQRATAADEGGVGQGVAAGRVLRIHDGSRVAPPFSGAWNRVSHHGQVLKQVGREVCDRGLEAPLQRRLRRSHWLSVQIPPPTFHVSDTVEWLHASCRAPTVQIVVVGGLLSLISR